MIGSFRTYFLRLSALGVSLHFSTHALAQDSRDPAPRTETPPPTPESPDTEIESSESPDDVDVEVEVESQATPPAVAEPDADVPPPQQVQGSATDVTVKETLVQPDPESSASVQVEGESLKEKPAAGSLPPTRTASEAPPEPEVTPLVYGLNYRQALPLGLELSGFIQAQVQGSQLSEDQLDSDGESLNKNTFGVRRARLGVYHGWRYAYARLELDASTWSGAPVRIRRAEASVLYRAQAPLEVAPPLVLTVGVTDVPFGAELAESQLTRLFMEQSLPSQALFPTPADLGAKFWGVHGPFEYALAVVNGEPTGEDGLSLDLNSAKDFAGRVGAMVLPTSSVLVAGGASVYLGTGFSPGVPATKDSSQWVDLNNNGVAEPSEIQGVTGSSALPSQNYSRFAVAMDLRSGVALPIGPLEMGGEVFVASNMDRGLLPHDPIASGTNSRQFGASFFATQDLGRHVSVGFRGAYYDPNSNIIEQRAGVFHLRNQTFWQLSPVAALKIEHVRLSAEYDVVLDHLGRDSSGVPKDLKNNLWTLRLQVDL